jgi:Rha family phage regulatory protein
MVFKRKTTDKSNPTTPNKTVATVDAVIDPAPGAEVSKLAQQTQDAKVEAYTSKNPSNFIEDVLPKLVVIEGRPTASSLEVAEMFGKMHKDVLEAIRKSAEDCSEEFSQRNFTPRDYTDQRGKTQPMYNLTKNGFTMLAMGFVGKRAAAFKEAYIAQFEAMESQQIELRIDQERKLLQERLQIPLPYHNDMQHAHVLKRDYGIYGQENAIFGMLIGNLMARLDGVLSETAVNEFKKSFMADWTRELYLAKQELDNGTNLRLGTEYYADIRKTIDVEISDEGKRRERLGFKVDSNKLVEELRAKPTQEHLFAFVLHLLGEFSEKKFRRFSNTGLKRDVIKLRDLNEDKLAS